MVIKIKDTNNQELISLVNPKEMIDLSTLPYTGDLSLELEILQGEVEIIGYRTTYLSAEKLSLTFKGKIKSDIILPDEIINTAYISTTTPETAATNNITTHHLYTETTDLAITKHVDKSSAGIGDELTYTITYENKGPKEARNVVIKDILPSSLTYLSSSPQLSSSEKPNGYWRLEYRTDYYPYEISFELTDGGGNILAQKTTSTHNTNNTTYIFTGQLTVAGQISLSRRDNHGDGDGSYKLYMDEVLILEGVTRSSTKTTETKTYTGFIPTLPVPDMLSLPTLPV
ncbi:MAG: DUF11 domain-containing protein [Candidatus Peribacteria bacterium]|nr:DUF11 domain-containing protein [Candidatus Peribacteria bacterium]